MKGCVSTRVVDDTFLCFISISGGEGVIMLSIIFL